MCEESDQREERGERERERAEGKEVGKGHRKRGVLISFFIFVVSLTPTVLHCGYDPARTHILHTHIMHTHARTWAHTRTNMRTYTLTHTHTYTCTHAHNYMTAKEIFRHTHINLLCLQREHCCGEIIIIIMKVFMNIIY